ncbi:MAG: hypothetical protein Q4D38_14055 [Planctomycetia bacterium]|nr:hypothetical protein [Planctomycetia bacterium]
MPDNIKKFEEREIRYMYEAEDFSDTIRNEGLQVVHNGFEKCIVENIEEIKDIDHLPLRVSDDKKLASEIIETFLNIDEKRTG